MAAFKGTKRLQLTLQKVSQPKGRTFDALYACLLLFLGAPRLWTPDLSRAARGIPVSGWDWMESLLTDISAGVTVSLSSAGVGAGGGWGKRGH